MAIGFVQGKFSVGASGTVQSATFTSNVSSGDIIAAVLMTTNASGGITFTNTGTAGITFNAAGAVTINTSGGANQWFKHDALVNTSGTCTITATAASSVIFLQLFVGEFTVGGHSLVRDVTDVERDQTTTTSFASGSITTVNNPDLLICFYSNNGSSSAFTGGITAGWAENVWDSGNQAGFASTSVTTPAAYSLTATQTSGGDTSLIMAYQATTSGTTPINATASLTGHSVFSHGGRLLNNASVSI